MEIKSNFSLDEIANANYESKKTIKIIYLIINIISLFGMILLFILAAKTDKYMWYLFLFLLTFSFVFTLFFVISIRPNAFKKRLLKFNNAILNGIEYTYIFDIDNIKIIEKTFTSESNNTIRYSMIKKVKLTNNYLFLYFNQIQAFAIKRIDINDDEFKELKELLNINERKN